MSSVFSGLFKNAWRKYVVDGVPSSGASPPSKDDIQPIGVALDSALDTITAQILQAAPNLNFSTWAALVAVAGTVGGQQATVASSDGGTHTDPVVGGTVDNAGVYGWHAASPAGWQRLRDLLADPSDMSAAIALKTDQTLSVGAFGALAAGTWDADHPEGIVHDYVRQLGALRDLTTPANNVAGDAASVGTFARALAAYRINREGNLESVASGLPRYQYDGDGNQLGLLFEPAVVNRLLAPDSFSNASWGKTNVTVTEGAVTLLGVSFDKLATTSASATAFSQTVTGAGSSSGNTFSILVAQGSGPTDGGRFLLRNATTGVSLLDVSLNLTTGAITYNIGGGGTATGAKATALGSGVWLLQLSAPSGIAGGNNLTVYAGFPGTTQSAGVYVYVAKANLFDGAAVDMLPVDMTTGSAITKPADSFVTTIDLPVDAGTLFCEWGPQKKLSAGSVLVRLRDGGGNNEIYIGMTSGGQISATVVVAGSVTANEATSVDQSSGGKAAIAWGDGGVSFYVDGVPVLATAATLPTGLTVFEVGAQLNGIVARDAFWTRALNEADLIALTAQAASTAATIAPGPDQPMLGPRSYSVVGKPISIYNRNLRAGNERLVRLSAGTLPSSFQYSERWTLNSGIAFDDAPLTAYVQDHDDLSVKGSATMLMTCVDQTTIGGASKKVHVTGDSTSSGGQWVQKVLDLAAATPSSLQPNFIGTQGTGSAKHEGHSGYSIPSFYDPSGTIAGQVNPYSISGSHFNFAGYLSANSLATPDIWVLHCSINGIFSQPDDASASAYADADIAMIDAMIGLTTVSGIGSVKAANSNIKVVLCLSPPSTTDQGGFGVAYNQAYYRERYIKNHLIYCQRLIDHYASHEGDGVFILDLNAHVDTKYGFNYLDEPGSDLVAAYITTAATYAGQIADLSPADGAVFSCTDIGKYLTKVGPSGKGFYRQSDERDGIIRRADNGLHDTKTPGYYQEVGMVVSHCLNVLVAKGWA